MSTSMTKELRRTSIIVLVMVASLFVSTSIIQVVDSDALAAAPTNARTFYANNSVNRGPILVEGNAVAYSVPSDGPIAYQRVYSDGALYAAVTGYLPIGGQNTGLEAAMNGYLTGTSGGQFLDQLNAVLTGQRPAGAAVETTISAKAQQAAYDALGDLTGAAIAIDPKTGKILAMVSKPSFDPNLLAVHDTTQQAATYAELLDDPSDPLINRAMNGDLDPPGSTFKLVVAAAALEDGYTSDSTFANPSELQLPQSSSVIHNITRGTCGGGADQVSIFDAVKYSCNIPMAELGEELTYQPIFDKAEAFGFNKSVDIAKVDGSTGMSSTASNYDRYMDVPTTMLSAFGQANDRASPLQMAMVSAAIANGGTLMQPQLVDSVIGSDQSTLVSFQPQTYGQPINSDTASALTAMMVASVDSGAASGAKISGISVAGKTGTAQNGTGQPNTVWFTGFAPADDPQLVVAVVVQGITGDETGSKVAAPVAKAIFQAVINQ